MNRTELAALPEGARVVVRLPHGRELADALLDCFDHHLVAVPLPPRAPDSTLSGIAEEVSASAVVDASGVRLTGAPAEHPDAAGLAFIMFTSGSTGPQKGVMLSRDAVLGNARKTAELHGFTPDRPHGTCLPLYHCNALMMSLLGTHITGTPLVLHADFDPGRYFAELAAAGARTASLVPALLSDLVELAPPWPDELEYLITAAAPLTSDLARRFHRLYGPRLRQGYGLTEAVNFSFTSPPLDDDAFTRAYLDEHPPVGEALPGTELRLEAGEVWIRTPDVMTGYWQNPTATKAALTPDGWLRTGDLGELRDGVLVLRGRSGERINRGGEKYHPLDVEATWREAGLTGRFAAVAVADPVLGQDIGLVAGDATAAQVREVVARAALRPAAVQLGGYRATSTGKPQRTAMGRGLVARRQAPARFERVFAEATATAHALTERGTRDRLAQELAAQVLRRQPLQGHLDLSAVDTTVLKAELLATPLFSDHDELAAETRAALLATGVDDAGLVVTAHLSPATRTDGRPWALLALCTQAGIGHPPVLERWTELESLRGKGYAVVGWSALRTGSDDLGGVVWAHGKNEQTNEGTGASA